MYGRTFDATKLVIVLYNCGVHIYTNLRCCKYREPYSRKSRGHEWMFKVVENNTFQARMQVQNQRPLSHRKVAVHNSAPLKVTGVRTDLMFTFRQHGYGLVNPIPWQIREQKLNSMVLTYHWLGYVYTVSFANRNVYCSYIWNINILISQNIPSIWRGV